MGEQRVTVGRNDLIHACFPKTHPSFLLILGPQLGGFQEDDHQPVQGVDLVLGEVVFGHDDVRLAHLGTFPGEQPEMGIGGVRPSGDEFGGGFPRHGED